MDAPRRHTSHRDKLRDAFRAITPILIFDEFLSRPDIQPNHGNSRGLPRRADLVVVGAGLAGLTVAAEAARLRDADIVILEAGPDAGDMHYHSTADDEAALDMWLDPSVDPHFWRPYTTEGLEYAGMAGLRRRVGGRSLYWHGVTLRIEPWALRSSAWPDTVVSDLIDRWDGGAALYDRVERELAMWTGETEPRRHAGEPVVPGYELAPTPQAVRSQADGGWQAFTPLEFWRNPDGRRDARPPIFSECTALGVILENGAAAGVRVRHGAESLDIAADRVVLAAGTIENSRLAIQCLSEVGRDHELRLRGLVDKVAHGITATFDIASLPPELVECARAGAYLHARCPDELRSNLFVTVGIAPAGACAVDMWLMGEQSRGSGNAVRCERAPEWPWPAHVEAWLGDEDRTLCGLQHEELQRIWDGFCDTTGVPSARLDFSEPFGTPDLTARLRASRAATSTTSPVTYSFPLGWEQHEAATTPLGDLLDSDHQFVDVPKLYAAGPSCFPRTGAANPGLTVLALSRRLGARLAGSTGDAPRSKPPQSS